MGQAKTIVQDLIPIRPIGMNYEFMEFDYIDSSTGFSLLTR